MKEKWQLAVDDIQHPPLWKQTWKLLFQPRRILNKLMQAIASKSFVTPRMRSRLHLLRGVHFEDWKSTYIGENVFFDDAFSDRIHIGKNVYITSGARILSHFYDPSFKDHCFRLGTVVIEDDVFIGMNVVIASSVTLRRGCVIGANSVVTMDVPPDTIVGGVPAKIIGKRGDDTSGWDPSLE